MQICHGMSEYLMRYETFAEELNEKGILVIGEDHPGHGESDGVRGHFDDKGGFEYLIECNMTVNMKARKLAHENGDVPLVLFGHSMGSFIARVLSARDDKTGDGFIFMGTAGKNPALSAGKFVASLCIGFGGGRKPNHFIDKMAFGSYAKKIEDPQTSFDWLSNDKEAVARYVKDERCGFPFTSAGYRDLFTMLREIQKPAWAASLNKDKPYLVIAGQDDPVGEFGKGVDEVVERMKNAGVRDVTEKLYPGMRHEILNDSSHDETVEDILKWLSEKGLVK